MEKAFVEYLGRLKREFPTFVRFGEGDDERAATWICDAAPQPLDELEAFYLQRSLQEEQDQETPTGGNAGPDVELEELLIDDPINRIFFGPPGCGKTFHIKTDLIPKYRGPDGARYRFVTFHPSMSYEEFVEGLRPITDEATKELKYEVKVRELTQSMFLGLLT